MEGRHSVGRALLGKWRPSVMSEGRHLLNLGYFGPESRCANCFDIVNKLTKVPNDINIGPKGAIKMSKGRHNSRNFYPKGRHFACRKGAKIKEGRQYGHLRRAPFGRGINYYKNIDQGVCEYKLKKSLTHDDLFDLFL